MVKYVRLISVILMIISLSSIYAQSYPEEKQYWIYTTSSEMKDYQINAIEGDELAINNGNWDVKIPLAEIELIALPPKPSLLGQIVGSTIGGYGGVIGGCLIGVMIFPAALAGDGSQLTFFMLTGAAAGVYYGKIFGGNFLKAAPEILVDMTMWTLDEKKEWIQANLIE